MTMNNTCHSNNNQRDDAETCIDFNTLAWLPFCQASRAGAANRKSNQLPFTYKDSQERRGDS